MALLTLKRRKRVRCTGCGARNPVSRDRCRTCTKPIPPRHTPTQEIADEVLWSTPIATPGPKRHSSTTKYVLAFVLLASLAVSNYFVFGFGPAWASDVAPHDKGYDWRTYDAGTYEVDMPGAPINETGTLASNDVNTAYVWVNSRWDLLLDTDTRASGVRKTARQELYGTIVSAETAGIPDLKGSAPVILRSLLDNVQITKTVTSTVESPDVGTAIDATAKYSNHPDEASSGIVKARIWGIGNRTYVTATFYDDTVDPGLHEKLVNSFMPDAPKLVR